MNCMECDTHFRSLKELRVHLYYVHGIYRAKKYRRHKSGDLRDCSHRRLSEDTMKSGQNFRHMVCGRCGYRINIPKRSQR